MQKVKVLALLRFFAATGRLGPRLDIKRTAETDIATTDDASFFKVGQGLAVIDVC